MFIQQLVGTSCNKTRENMLFRVKTDGINKQMSMFLMVMANLSQEQNCNYIFGILSMHKKEREPTIFLLWGCPINNQKRYVSASCRLVQLRSFAGVKGHAGITG